MGGADGVAALGHRIFAVAGDRRLHRFDQRRQGRFRIARHRHVDALEALEILIVRLGEQFGRADADQFCARLDLGGVAADAVVAVVDKAVHRVPVIRQLQADDDVGRADHGRGTAERMGVRKIHPVALIDHRRLQQLGKLDQALDAVGRARHAIDHDDRPLGVDEEPRGFLHRAGIALRRGAGEEFRNVELFAVLADRLGLQAAVERHHHRAIRRCGRDLVHAHEGLREMLRRHRGVVPLGIVAHDGVDVLRGMEGRHAGRAFCRVEIVAAHDQHRHAVAPGVVDRHGGVLQPDHAVDQAS